MTEEQKNGRSESRGGRGGREASEIPRRPHRMVSLGRCYFLVYFLEKNIASKYLMIIKMCDLICVINFKLLLKVIFFL